MTKIKKNNIVTFPNNLSEDNLSPNPQGIGHFLNHPVMQNLLVLQ